MDYVQIIRIITIHHSHKPSLIPSHIPNIISQHDLKMLYIRNYVIPGYLHFHNEPNPRNAFLSQNIRSKPPRQLKSEISNDFHFPNIKINTSRTTKISGWSHEILLNSIENYNNLTILLLLFCSLNINK